MKIVSPPLARASGPSNPSNANVTAIGSARPWLARMPPAWFAIPFGVLGLAGAWQRLAGLLLPFSGDVVVNVVTALLGTGTSLLELFFLLWIIKWFRHRSEVVKDFADAVSGAMLSLAPLSTLLAAALWVPRLSGQAAALVELIAFVALTLQALIAWRVMSRVATGDIAADRVTPALYLPPLGGGLIGALAFQALGYHGFAVLLFGMAMGAWAMLEARVLNRLFAGPLAPPLRATIGVEIAPAAVATLVAATLWPELPADALLAGIGVSGAALVMVLARWRWWTAVPFSVSFWSFSFPAAALASAVVEAVRRGGWPTQVALGAVVVASALIVFLAVRSVLLLGRR